MFGLIECIMHAKYSNYNYYHFQSNIFFETTDMNNSKI